MTGIEWHSYITASPYQAFEGSPAYAEYRKQTARFQAACALKYGDLRELNVAKKIIQERTQPIAIAKGHPPFCFRFQCLTTGRKSKFIKENDYAKFGISFDDARIGAGYSEATVIDDKMAPIIADSIRRVGEIMKEVFGHSSSNLWWARYNEYLQSEQWYEKRRQVLNRDDWKCVITGSASNLQVHHMTYANVGNENLHELVTLCESAHNVIHDPANRDHAHFRMTLKNRYGY